MSDVAELFVGLALLLGALVVWRRMVVRRRSRSARLARREVGSALSPVQELQGVPARAPRPPVSTHDTDEEMDSRRAARSASESPDPGARAAGSEPDPGSERKG